jgi:hypothetical protein
MALVDARTNRPGMVALLVGFLLVAVTVGLL